MAIAKTKKTSQAAAKPALKPETVQEILELARRSKSIELKLSVPVTGHRATIASIGLDPVEAQPRQVFFFDTPDLALNKAGLIVRARRIQGGSADTVVKLRPIDPAAISADLRRSASFKIELDIMPGGYVCSGSAKGDCTGEEVLEVTTGMASIRSLFSKEQRAFFNAHAPAGISMNSLLVLGPTFLLKAKHQPKAFKRDITIEMWLYPDGSRVLEISTKCLPSEAIQVGAEFKAYLADRGIPVEAKQQTKTATALAFFKAEMDAGKSGSKPAKK